MFKKETKPSCIPRFSDKIKHYNYILIFVVHFRNKFFLLMSLNWRVLLSFAPSAYTKTLYQELLTKYNLYIDCFPFNTVQQADFQMYRKEYEVLLHSLSHVLLTTLNSANYFFRFCRHIGLNPDKRFFYYCTSEFLAGHVNKIMPNNRRKCFYPTAEQSLYERLLSLKNTTLLYPCSPEFPNASLIQFFEKEQIAYRMLKMYHIYNNPHIKKLQLEQYQVLIFISVGALSTFFQYFPPGALHNKIIGIFGENTAAYAYKKGIRPHFFAPNDRYVSLIDAFEGYIKNKKI